MSGEAMNGDRRPLPAAVEFFDLTTLDPGCKGYSGVVGDGRYLYFVPNVNGAFFGTVARYDSCASFGDAASWSLFDSATLNSASRGFIDALFDGRYIYFVPFHNDAHHGQVTRYDTRGGFDDPASWAFFDTTVVSERSRGFVSGVFDGRYIYLAPYMQDWQNQHGQVTRHDTQSSFDDPDSWEVFDCEALWPDARGFHSALHDGRYVYLVPYLSGGDHYSGRMVRFDTRGGFGDSAAWSSVDLSRINEGARGFVGGCFDGEHLYLAPYRNQI